MRTRNRAARRIRGLSCAASILLLILAVTVRTSHGAELKQETLHAFERYVQSSEARMDQELAGKKSFLSIDALPESSRNEAYARLRRGEIITERFPPSDSHEVVAIPGGLIHDWVGIVFVPGISIMQTLAMLEDYDRDAQYYGPEVLQSKLLDHSGDDFRVFLRLKRTRIVTAVYDTEYDVRYARIDDTRVYSRSYSTRIAEVDDAGTPQEHERPVGDDRGFLWRLNSYWRFLQADGGTYIQCDAISLTREIPAGLGWLVRPFIDSIPADSLRSTLDATRRALLEHPSGQSAAMRTR